MTHQKHKLLHMFRNQFNQAMTFVLRLFLFSLLPNIIAKAPVNRRVVRPFNSNKHYFLESSSLSPLAHCVVICRKIYIYYAAQCNFFPAKLPFTVFRSLIWIFYGTQCFSTQNLVRTLVEIVCEFVCCGV